MRKLKREFIRFIYVAVNAGCALPFTVLADCFMNRNNVNFKLEKEKELWIN